MPNKLISHIIFWYDHPFLVNNGEKKPDFYDGEKGEHFESALVSRKMHQYGFETYKKKHNCKKKIIKILLIL